MKSFYKMSEEELENARLFLGEDPIRSDEQIKRSIYYEMVKNANKGMPEKKVIAFAREAWEEDDQYRYEQAVQSVKYEMENENWEAYL